MKLSGGALACSRPWIKFSSTGENGKKEKERKPKAAGKGRLEGIKSARSTQVTGGGEAWKIRVCGCWNLQVGPVHHVTQSQCQPLPISSIYTTGPMLRAELRTQPLRIDQPPQTQPKSSQTKESSLPPRNSNQCGIQLLLLPSFPVWVGKLRLKRFIQVYLGTPNKKTTLSI